MSDREINERAIETFSERLPKIDGLEVHSFRTWEDYYRQAPYLQSISVPLAVVIGGGTNSKEVKVNGLLYVDGGINEGTIEAKYVVFDGGINDGIINVAKGFYSGGGIFPNVYVGQNESKKPYEGNYEDFPSVADAYRTFGSALVAESSQA